MSYFITQSTTAMIYPAAVLLGLGFSSMLVCSLSFATELIGENKVNQVHFHQTTFHIMDFFYERHFFGFDLAEPSKTTRNHIYWMKWLLDIKKIASRPMPPDCPRILQKSNHLQMEFEKSSTFCSVSFKILCVDRAGAGTHDLARCSAN